MTTYIFGGRALDEQLFSDKSSLPRLEQSSGDWQSRIRESFSTTLS